MTNPETPNTPELSGREKLVRQLIGTHASLATDYLLQKGIDPSVAHDVGVYDSSELFDDKIISTVEYDDGELHRLALLDATYVRLRQSGLWPMESNSLSLDEKIRDEVRMAYSDGKILVLDLYDETKQLTGIAHVFINPDMPIIAINQDETDRVTASHDLRGLTDMDVMVTDQMEQYAGTGKFEFVSNETCMQLAEIMQNLTPRLGNIGEE